MSNIKIDHVKSGVMHVRVIRSQRITPSVQRVTFSGIDLERLRWRGFDQWVRLFLPANDPSDLDHVPHRLTPRSWLRLQAVPSAQRPRVRSYTMRAWRAESRELDIDFVIHGDQGVAGPWAIRATAGDVAAILDQGCGWPKPEASRVVLVGDASGLPAVAGVLRDLPRDTTGLAIIEIPDPADAQPTDAPHGVDVRWLVRRAGRSHGETALAELADVGLPVADRHAFAVGAAGLATGARRHLVRDRGWGKDEVTFCGYWR